MKYTQSLLNSLSDSPRLLQELIHEIPKERLTAELIPGKWTIHEHATHVSVGDKYGFQKRLEQFIAEDRPTIEPLSGDNFDSDFFINLDLDEALDEFILLRNKTIELATQLPVEVWHKEADHPEYSKYTPYIMLRHLLMHDHTHMYKIEDMGFGVSV